MPCWRRCARSSPTRPRCGVRRGDGQLMTVTGTEAAMAVAVRPPRQPLFVRYRAHLVDIAQFLVLAGLLGWLTVRGAQSMGYSWQWYRVPQYFYRVVDGEFIWGPLA